MAGTEYASILHNHASLLAVSGRLQESQAILQDVWSRGLKNGQQWQPHYLYARHTQSVQLNQMGKPEEALAVMEEAIAGRRKSLGPAHPTTLISEFGRVTLLVKLKRPERALEFLNEIMPRAEQAWPPGNPSLLRAKLQKANVLDALQQSDAARAMYRDLIAAAVAQQVPAEFELQIRGALADNLLRNKQVSESLAEYQQLLAIGEKSMSENPSFGRYLMNAAKLDLQIGNPAAARLKLARTQAIFQKGLPSDSPLLVELAGLMERAK